MKKIIIAFVVVALGGLTWFGLKPKASPAGNQAPEVSDNATISTSAWIQVDSPLVSKLGDDGAATGEFADGDIIEAGMTIKTDASGSGSIYFSDGSTLRLDPNTTVKITEANYQENTGSLGVRVTLVAGRVWSKITALATPDSLWEVRTGTAVATVRGSAFGTEITVGGDTNIIGSEHDVTLTPLDIGGQILVKEQIIVGEKETATIGKTHKVVKKPIDSKHPLFAWGQSNEKRDQVVRDEIKTLQEQGLKGRDLHQHLREFLHTPIKQRLPQPVENKLEQRIDQKQIQTQTQTQIQITAHPTVASIEVNQTSGGSKATEGDTLNFRAEAVFSDGTKKDVTALVSWHVVGSIGAITAPGQFKAALGPDVSELGTAFGAVTVSFKTEIGKELIGKSGIITVVAAPPDVGIQDTRG